MKFLLVFLALGLTLALIVIGSTSLASAATALTLAVGLSTAQFTIAVLALALVAMGVLILLAAGSAYRRGQESVQPDIDIMQRQLDRARARAPKQIGQPQVAMLPPAQAVPQLSAPKPRGVMRRRGVRSAGVGIARRWR